MELHDGVGGDQVTEPWSVLPAITELWDEKLRTQDTDESACALFCKRPTIVGMRGFHCLSCDYSEKHRSCPTPVL